MGFVAVRQLKSRRPRRVPWVQLGVLVIGVMGWWMWRQEQQRIAAAQPVPYLSAAIVGNGHLLAALDGRGTIINLYWPHPGQAALLRNPFTWTKHPRHTPPATGCFLGFRRGDGPVIWLREMRVLSQMYDDDTNRLVTRYQLAWGRTVTVTDWAPPGDRLIRRVTVSPRFGRGMRLVAWQHFAVGGTAVGSAEVVDGALVHAGAGGPAVAVGSDVPVHGIHIGDASSFDEFSHGPIENSDRLTVDQVTAAHWPITGTRTVIYTMGANRREALAQVTASPDDDADATRQWLAAGRMPAMPARDQRLYRRSLLTLRMLQDGRTGALVAGARDFWQYCWPRDGVYGALAFDCAGHHAEALAIYRFLARTQGTDGGWAARYQADGTPVRDGRAPQLDAPGYFAWGVWLHGEMGGDRADVRALYPHVAAAARHILVSLDPRTGLPGPGADYWELSKERGLYLANAIVCQAGLRAAARLAEREHRDADADRFTAGAARITAGMARLWDGTRGVYLRAPGAAGVDSAIALAVPLGLSVPDAPRVAASMRRVEAQLTAGGGILPGEGWHGMDPWVPETALLIPYHCARGEMAQADALFDWLHRAATPAGLLPETVAADTGKPGGTTPLAWSHAAYIIAAEARWGWGLPKP